MRGIAPVIIIASLMTTGCATTSAKRLNEISVGMTKSEVIQILGNPESVSGNGSQELFLYTLSNSFTNAEWNSTYAVQFVEGRVVRYGRQ